MSRELSNLATIAAFLVVILAIVAGGGLLLLARPEPVEITIIPPEPTATRVPTATPGPLTIYITGAVTNPEQTLTLPPGSRVQDAISAAGGLLPTADAVRVNLADTLRDGAQVHVPFAGTIQGELDGGVVNPSDDVQAALELATPIGGVVVNVNTATAEELTALPGIGEVTAAQIVAYREANGPFFSLQDLDNVEGIGPATLGNIAPQVVFD